MATDRDVTVDQAREEARQTRPEHREELSAERTRAETALDTLRTTQPDQ